MGKNYKNPVIFLAYSNERIDKSKNLRNLSREIDLIRDELRNAKNYCDIVERGNATIKKIIDVLQDPAYRNRIAVFHYAGHADDYHLYLESDEGKAEGAEAGGIAGLLERQLGLKLVFLNGCSTKGQVAALLKANISAVIATSQSIKDEVAMQFASRFYHGLAGEADIETAYKEAEAEMQATTMGGDFRNLYYAGAQEEDRWPWDLYFREGIDTAGQWKLLDCVDNPLFGIPDLPRGKLPYSPFRNLEWFTRETAEVFFGRSREIRELYDQVTSPDKSKIVLFCGQSGVGKSSVLQAGLIPRLEANYAVRYLRRDQEKGLLDTLREAFLPEEHSKPKVEAWIPTEAKLGKPW